MPLEAMETTLEASPRIGPVPGATSRFETALRASGALQPYPWQQYALQVMMETDGDRFRYREVCVVVARQNGKTELLVPRIAAALSSGRRVLHTAQNRIIPRRVFMSVARLFPDAHIRLANGQEEISVRGGGSYTIIAPQKGVRGHSADDLIIDEIREYKDFDFIAAAEPTLTASADPQVIYLSNAGDEESIVLNDLRIRGLNGDRDLAYLEWSSEPGRAVDDRDGWLEANPSIGYGPLTLDRLQAIHDKYKEANQLAIFETEHLCRWVVSMAPRAVSDAAWQMARATVQDPVSPMMGISVDPDGKRVSVAYAWRQDDGTIGLLARDFTGAPIDLTALAVDLQKEAIASGVQMVGFDPWTDQHLARHFDRAKPINGQEYANASERFVRSIETGMLKWQHANPVSEDLPYAGRKATTGTAWLIEGVKEGRSVTGVLAAIRAVWLATAPPLQSAVF